MPKIKVVKKRDRKEIPKISVIPKEALLGKSKIKGSKTKNFIDFIEKENRSEGDYITITKNLEKIKKKASKDKKPASILSKIIKQQKEPPNIKEIRERFDIDVDFDKQMAAINVKDEMIKRDKYRRMIWKKVPLKEKIRILEEDGYMLLDYPQANEIIEINGLLLPHTKKFYNKTHKNLDEVPEDVEEAVDAMTWDNNKSTIFGSYAYRVHSTAGDIDIQEVILGKKTKKDLIERTTHILNGTLKEIKSKRGFYFDEVKTGIDRSMYFGLENSKLISVPTEFKEIDSKDTKEDIDNTIKIYDLIKKSPNYKNLTKEEIKDIKIMAINREYRAIQNYIYRKQFLRFDEKALKKGYTLQRDGKERTIESAIEDGTMLKITAWCPIDGVYTELTNFYFLVLDKKGKSPEYLNFSKKNYVDDIRKNIELFIQQKNYYKALKRMWGLSLYMDATPLNDLLSPFFRGTAGLAGKMKTDATTIIDLLERVRSPPYKTLKKQIDNWKGVINNMLPVEYEEGKIVLPDQIQEWNKPRPALPLERKNYDKLTVEEKRKLNRQLRNIDLNDIQFKNYMIKETTPPEKYLFKKINNIIDSDNNKKLWIKNLKDIKKKLEEFIKNLSINFIEQYKEEIDNWMKHIYFEIEKRDFEPEILPFVLEIIDKY